MPLNQEYLIRLTEDGSVTVDGLEMPWATLHAITKDVVTLRVPGHQRWAGRGMPTVYEPVSYEVWKIQRWEPRGAWSTYLTTFTQQLPAEARLKLNDRWRTKAHPMERGDLLPCGCSQHQVQTEGHREGCPSPGRTVQAPK